MSDFFDLIDLRLLLVLSPITTALAWAMLVDDLLPKHPWRF